MNNAERWILAGYHTFAKNGDSGLKIESLAREIGISKSSFYHHFIDSEVFMEHLLRHHLERISLLAEKEKHLENIDPQLIQVILEFKTDLLFNRQLRFCRHISAYADVLKKGDELFGNEFVLLLARELGLATGLYKLEQLYGLALENFFLQINETTLSHEWLTHYFKELKGTIKQIL